MIILVKGHTKNACDRIFNLLKLDYRSFNIFTSDKMISHLDVNAQISVREMKSCEFFDFLLFSDNIIDR